MSLRVMPHSISCGKFYNYLWNKILHVASSGIYTRVYTTHVIYTARLLAVEASYTSTRMITSTTIASHDIVLLVHKCILASYIMLSVTLYFAGITMPTKINGTHHAASN